MSSPPIPPAKVRLRPHVSWASQTVTAKLQPSSSDSVLIGNRRNRNSGSISEILSLSGTIKSDYTNIEGYLHKSRGETKTPKTFQKRYFKITGLKLQYKASEDGKLLGSIELSQVTNISALDQYSEPSKSKFVFQIVTSGRTYFLYAESAAERDSWIENLQQRSSLSSLISNETMQGFLWKESGSKIVEASSGLQRRWFSIDGTTIQYYDPKRGEEGKKKGSISLADIQSINVAETHHKGKYKFTVSTSSRKYQLYAESSEIRAKWVAYIQQYISSPVATTRTSSFPIPISTSGKKLIANSSFGSLDHLRSEIPGAIKSDSISLHVKNEHASGNIPSALGLSLNTNAFQKRFFVLSHGLLSFFKKVGGKTVGVINLSKIEEMKEVASGSKFILLIKTPGRTYHLQFGSEEKRRDWKAAIESQMNVNEGQNEEEEEEDVVATEHLPNGDNWFDKDPDLFKVKYLESEQLLVMFHTQFPINPSRFFYMFWSDYSSEFLSSYHCHARNDSNLHIEKWQPCPQLGHKRTVSYSTQVKIGGIEATTAPMEEAQRYVLTKDKLLIEIRSTLKNVPLAEFFVFEARWEAVSCGANTCFVTASCTCHFSKFVLLHKQITNSTIKQTKNSYNKWNIIAQSCIGKLPPKAKKVPLPKIPSIGSSNASPTTNDKSPPEPRSVPVNNTAPVTVKDPKKDGKSSNTILYGVSAFVVLLICILIALLL